MSDVMTRQSTSIDPDAFKPGTKVEVRSRFDRSWAQGFEVADACSEGYRLRRLSDDSVLPATFDADDVRRARKRNGMWWY